MIAAAVASTTSGSSAQPGASRKNGCSAAAGFVQQQRALAEVVQQQRRQHQREPREADRPLAEVPHVGVQRLAAGDDEEDRAEHGEAVPAVLAEERTPRGGDRPPSARPGSRTSHTMPSTAITDEPHHHDRPEQSARRGACRAAESRTPRSGSRPRPARRTARTAASRP